jgi:hypothetical protein
MMLLMKLIKDARLWVVGRWKIVMWNTTLFAQRPRQTGDNSLKVYRKLQCDGEKLEKVKDYLVSKKPCFKVMII